MGVEVSCDDAFSRGGRRGKMDGVKPAEQLLAGGMYMLKMVMSPTLMEMCSSCLSS